jgi:hypothetical protein
MHTLASKSGCGMKDLKTNRKKVNQVVKKEGRRHLLCRHGEGEKLEWSPWRSNQEGTQP